MKIPARFGLVLFLALALLDAGMRWQLPSQALKPVALVPQAQSGAQSCADYQVVREGLIPMPEGVPAAHASSLVALADKHPWHGEKALAAFWFAGTRESGADVQIAASTFDRGRQVWDTPTWVVNRHDMAKQMGIQIRRIGNPVAWSDGQGRLHLFVVATGLGGWAASRVVHLTEQTPLEFRVVRTLPLTALTPAFNTSTLVRTVPLPLSDGGALLPLYFEIGTQYSVAVRLDSTGQMQSITRMTQRRNVLQPSLVAHSPTHWSALMRDHSAAKKVAHTETFDAGEHWHDAPDLALSNADSSVAALRLSTGSVMLAHNPAGRGREVLLLSTSVDMPSSWSTRTLVDGAKSDEYSYPTLIEVPASNGLSKTPPDVWLSYTHMRKSIAYKQLRGHCAARSQP